MYITKRMVTGASVVVFVQLLVARFSHYRCFRKCPCINLPYCRVEKPVLINLFIKLIMRARPRSALS